LEQEVQNRVQLNDKKNFFESSLTKLQADYVQLDAEYKEALKYEEISKGLNEIIDSLKADKSKLETKIEVNKKERKNQLENFDLKLENLKREKDKAYQDMLLKKNSELKKIKKQLKDAEDGRISSTLTFS
jgi:hypothetical protein